MFGPGIFPTLEVPMGHRTTGPGYRTDRFVRGDGAIMVETIYDPDGNLVSHRSADPGGPGLRPLLSPAVEAALEAAAEQAAATDAGAREAEDRMDAYEALLDEGVRSIVVLCRAAVGIASPAPFYSEVASFLRGRGGLTTKSQKDGRKIVKRWCEGGRQSTVPQHCWDLLLKQLPPSNLKERLAKIGGAP